MIGGFFIVASVNTLAQDKKVFFRYTTSDGRKIVSQTIPPQYVRNGYEMLTIGGEILKVVPPSPPEADAERLAKERKLAKEQARTDLELRQTYSSVKDIDSAKARNLQELVNTISILQANLSSIKTQLKAQEEHAAAIERNGKTVSEDILKNISTLRAEEKDLNNQIKQRQAEYDGAAAKYEKDKARFIEIFGQPKQ
ncbi:hypothetical protein GCM10011613_32700 [Cellvibrio zantedeschiae]|uniref:DUF4124 domain-containing protein n=1 Tax=Cellvibrio zantedeschiae TaxID=1237077 RepID=A0ABQ3B8W8_9GAMM|nr:hypothetical protein GCM10011613_32700 [Cellvibrio zantedeschiae]